MTWSRFSAAAGVLLFAGLLHRQPAPDLSPPAIQRDAHGTVTLHPKAAGTLILYTLDGSEPVSTSNPYLAPIELPSGGTLKARASVPHRKVMGRTATADLKALPGHPPLPSTLVPVTQDRSWPQYDWAKRHALTCAAVRRQQPQLLFIGDSLIHFFGGERTDWPRRRGKAVWDEYYAPRNAGNLGCGWEMTENVLWRLQHGAVDGISPKAVVLLIGTNNIETSPAPDIVQGITAIVQELLSRLPRTNILLLGVFPRGEKPAPLRDKIIEVNQGISRLHAPPRIIFLDIGQKFLTSEGLITRDVLRDFLHPTEKGYQIWAEAMEPTLKKLLAE